MRAILTVTCVLILAFMTMGAIVRLWHDPMESIACSAVGFLLLKITKDLLLPD